jgi:phosphoglycerate kinase
MMLAVIDDVNFMDRQVILRLDLNTPMHDGRITDITRIERVIPTLRKILATNPRYIVIFSHLGRPKSKSPAEFSAEDSLLPVAEVLQSLLGKDVIFSNKPVGHELKKVLDSTPNGSIIMAENIRFYSGEKNNDANFSQTLASLGDIFVNDAFSCSHRAHSSVVGITNYLPSFTGVSFEAEIKALEQCVVNPKRPVIGIVAGSKVSTKIDLLINLLNKLDYLFLGGGIANTMLYAMGRKVGSSLVENDRIGVAETILQKAKTSRCKLILPIDAVVAKQLTPNTSTQVVDIDKIGLDQAIYDVGPQTLEQLKNTLRECKTVLWNGPVGVYEVPPFADGSIKIIQTISELTKTGRIRSIIGGGDTLAAISMSKTNEFEPEFSHISTAGGAFLEWLEGKSLPGIEALTNQDTIKKVSHY